mmetsp:Transcript_129879/g.289798  ORF Transcript_129879/g.289798 Transcript_129879/m.289798 type:complete len:537 (-) Transcript_129879:92-1702(-)
MAEYLPSRLRMWVCDGDDKGDRSNSRMREGDSQCPESSAIDALLRSVAEEHMRLIAVYQRENMELRRQLDQIRSTSKPKSEEDAAIQDSITPDPTVRVVEDTDILDEVAEEEQPEEVVRLASSKAMNERRSLIYKVVHSYTFQIIVNTIIVMNCLAMGLEAHAICDDGWGGARFEHWTWVADNVFTACFTVELLANVAALGLRNFWPDTGERRWHFLDSMLVLISILSTWLLPTMAKLDAFADLEGGGLRVLTVLRSIRVLRLARLVRTRNVFREAWLLIRGLGDSTTTFFWTCVVIFFVTYGFAIFGSVAIVEPLHNILRDKQAIAAPSQQELLDIADLEGLKVLYGGIDKLMYKLIQGLFVDSIHAEMDRLMAYLWYTWMYFYAYFGFAVIVLMNLVTAIIVDHAMACSKQDVEMAMVEKNNAIKKELHHLKRCFVLIDSDGSGCITWQEFEESFQNEDVMKGLAILGINTDDCKDLFDLLDDGDGSINMEEFLGGLGRVQGPAMARDVMRMEKIMRQARREATMVPYSPRASG